MEAEKSEKELELKVQLVNNQELEQFPIAETLVRPEELATPERTDAPLSNAEPPSIENEKKCEVVLKVHIADSDSHVGVQFSIGEILDCPATATVVDKDFSAKVLLPDKDMLLHLNGSSKEIDDFKTSTLLQPSCLTITNELSGPCMHVNTKEVVAGDIVADQMFNDWKRSTLSSLKLGVCLTDWSDSQEYMRPDGACRSGLVIVSSYSLFLWTLFILLKRIPTRIFFDPGINFPYHYL
jgi:hypothetical protein